MKIKIIASLIFLALITMLSGCQKSPLFQGMTVHIHMKKSINVRAIFEQEKTYCESFKQYLCEPFWGQPEYGRSNILFEVVRGEVSLIQKQFILGEEGYLITMSDDPDLNPQGYTLSLFSWGGADSLAALIEVVKRHGKGNPMIYSIDLSTENRKPFAETDADTLIIKLEEVLKKQRMQEAEK